MLALRTPARPLVTVTWDSGISLDRGGIHVLYNPLIASCEATGWDGSDMSFTVVLVIFTILTGIAGSLLANHYSVFALVPVTFFFLALAAAGCVVYGANLSGSAIAALSVVTGPQFGYLLRLFVLRSGRGPGAEAEARTTGRPTSTPRRSGWGCLGDLFRRAATHKSTNSASVC